MEKVLTETILLQDAVKDQFRIQTSSLIGWYGNCSEPLQSTQHKKNHCSPPAPSGKHIKSRCHSRACRISRDNSHTAALWKMPQSHVSLHNWTKEQFLLHGHTKIELPMPPNPTLPIELCTSTVYSLYAFICLYTALYLLCST